MYSEGHKKQDERTVKELYFQVKENTGWQYI